MKIKLIELLKESSFNAADYCSKTDCEDCNESGEGCFRALEADYLIANGVTIQRWIPVEERLPDVRGKYLISRSAKWLTNPIFEVADFANDLYKVDSYDFPNMKGKSGFYSYDDEWGFFEIDSITHWMPLPEPPKEK